jgi:hypothetical protein
MSSCANMMPCAFLNHGGGPMPLLGRQPELAEALVQYAGTLPTPSAILGKKGLLMS